MKSYKDLKELFESTTTADVAVVDTKLDLQTRIKILKDNMKKIKEPEGVNETINDTKDTKDIQNTEDTEELNEGKTPEDILRKNNIKIKSSEMDDDSYVILLFKKDEMSTAKKLLEKEGYIVHEVGKLLYIS